jgi:hypothetical protein
VGGVRAARVINGQAQGPMGRVPDFRGVVTRLSLVTWLRNGASS